MHPFTGELVVNSATGFSNTLINPFEVFESVELLFETVRITSKRPELA